MSFRDLQFNYNKFKTDVQSQIAKNNPMQKQDTKSLSLWIFHERTDLATQRTLAYQHSETNKALKQWIQDEKEEEKYDNCQDLEDIVGEKLIKLLDKQVEIEQEYADKYQQYRHAIKAIREREEKLSDPREKKRSLQSRINNLNRSNSRSPKLQEFQKELRSLTSDTFESEMDLADFKRFALKEAFYLRFNAMSEYAEKTALIAGFGKYLTDLINIEPTPPSQTKRRPYDKGEEANMILEDAMKAIKEWRPLAADERATLANSSEPTKTPPPLPTRKPEVDTMLPVLNVSSGYTPTQEVADNTGDLKIENESEVDIDKLNLYDAPPPAYSAPANNEAKESQESFDFSQSSFGSPYPSHASLAPMSSPYPSQINLTDSPVPMHSQLTQSNSTLSLNDNVYPPRQYMSNYDPNSMMMYNQVNYQQLYRHVSQRHQNQHYRPYSEFQQQVNHPQTERRDAGGFRIPPPQTTPQTTEDEKARLEEHYRQLEQTLYYSHEPYYHHNDPQQYPPHGDQHHGIPQQTNNVLVAEKEEEQEGKIEEGVTSSIIYSPPNTKDSDKYED